MSRTPSSRHRCVYSHRSGLFSCIVSMTGGGQALNWVDGGGHRAGEGTQTAQEVRETSQKAVSAEGLRREAWTPLPRPAEGRAPLCGAGCEGSGQQPARLWGRASTLAAIKMMEAHGRPDPCRRGWGRQEGPGRWGGGRGRRDNRFSSSPRIASFPYLPQWLLINPSWSLPGSGPL